ncbi:MAG: hypothetical protein M0O96_07455 [Desulforhopalus sp.]|nr:hypothetical protein [Desulforhopalus sp.]
MSNFFLRKVLFLGMSALCAGLLTSCADTSCSRLVGCQQDVCYSGQNFYAAAAARDADALGRLIPKMADEVKRCYPPQGIEFTREKSPGAEQGGDWMEEGEVLDLAVQAE